MAQSWPEREAIPVSYLMRSIGAEISPESSLKLEALLTSGTDSEDLTVAVRTLISGLDREASVELDGDNFLVQVNGPGVKKVFRMILDYEFEKPTLCLVEEPEMDLHPALEANIMRYLQGLSTSCQVFLTTRSTNFLNSAGLTNVHLVSKDKSTTVQLLDLQEAEAVLPSELDLRMSSLFMYDRLVFVEGPTDESVIREWAAILRVNLSQAGVGFVRMGGARNFSHYASAATLSFLAKRRVRSWILLDRDERDNEEIDRFKKTAGDLATVKVLDQREIENLFLVPRAIVELIKVKMAASGSGIKKADPGPNEQQITVALDETFEKLKSVAADKRYTAAHYHGDIVRPEYTVNTAIWR